MWKNKLQNVYKNYWEFDFYCRLYNNHKRLDYNTPREAWKANPIIQGSSNPNDYKIVKSNKENIK